MTYSIMGKIKEKNNVDFRAKWTALGHSKYALLNWFLGQGIKKDQLIFPGFNRGMNFFKILSRHAWICFEQWQRFAVPLLFNDCQ